jgi:hypothetical protein
MMPYYELPLAIRRDPGSSMTGVMISTPDQCFGICTPYGEEEHYSTYFSLFGYDIGAGERASARARFILMPDPTDDEILEAAMEFLKSLP